MNKVRATQVAVGFHSYGTCTTQFAIALAGVVRYEGTKIAAVLHVPSPYVTEARNKIVYRFLTRSKATHLWMVDVDLDFPEDALNVTLQDMQKEDAEVMFGTYALGDFRPSIFSPPAPNSTLPTVCVDLEGSKIYEVYAGSTGWLVMTRKAAQQVWDANKDKHWPWFDHDEESAGGLAENKELQIEGKDTIRIGEDFTFSKRARECGVKLYGTTRPLLIHQKYQPLLNHFQEQQAIDRGIKTNHPTKRTEDKKDELVEGVSIRVGEQSPDQKGSDRGQGASGEDQGQAGRGRGDGGPESGAGE